MKVKDFVAAAQPNEVMMAYRELCGRGDGWDDALVFDRWRQRMEGLEEEWVHEADDAVSLVGQLGHKYKGEGPCTREWCCLANTEVELDQVTPAEAVAILYQVAVRASLRGARPSSLDGLLDQSKNEADI